MTSATCWEHRDTCSADPRGQPCGRMGHFLEEWTPVFRRTCDQLNLMTGGIDVEQGKMIRDFVCGLAILTMMACPTLAQDSLVNYKSLTPEVALELAQAT